MKWAVLGALAWLGLSALLAPLVGKAIADYQDPPPKEKPVLRAVPANPARPANLAPRAVRDPREYQDPWDKPDQRVRPPRA